MIRSFAALCCSATVLFTTPDHYLFWGNLAASILFGLACACKWAGRS